MSEALAAVLSVGILMLAAGLFVWSMARARQERAVTRINLDKQLAQSRVGLAAASSYPANPAMSSAMSSGTPQRDAKASGGLASFGNWGNWEMPPWLLGAVPQTAALLVPGVVLAVTGLIAWGIGAVSAVAFFLLACTALAFTVWLRLQSRRRKLVAQLPGFMDSMVRFIAIGNSTQSAFQTAASTAKEPLRAYMDRVSAMLRAGVELEPALLQVAQGIRIDELVLLASVLGLGVRYGGRADVLLERMANFMRDEEQANRELQALSAETRLSAWILGLLPVLVGAMIVIINANYFTLMWADPSGRSLMMAALGLQLLGGLILWRMARLD